jgi:hypothetical protein
MEQGPGLVEAIQLLERQAQDGAQAADAIRELNRLWTDAWLAADVGAIDALMAPEYTYTEPNGDVLDRTGVLALARSATYHLERGKRSEVHVTALGDDSAVLLCRWQGAGSRDGKAFTEDHRCSSLWWRRQGRWRLAWEHRAETAG